MLNSNVNNQTANITSTQNNIPISKELLQNIPNLYETEGVNNPMCHIKLFTPDSSWSWYIIEVSKDNFDICYGYVCGLENELGYFSLKELSTLTGLMGLAIEQDVVFKPTPLLAIKKQSQR